MPGRYRKPAKLRILEGNRSRTPIPKAIEVTGAPLRPEHFTPEQIDRWEDILGSLPVGYLSQADTSTLERMAVAWAEYRQAVAELSGQPIALPRGDGVIPNPLLAIRDRAANEMRKAGAELGLSPLARTRLTRPETSEKDPLETLLGKIA